MGPGGLDPVEVFESLPAELQECTLAAFLRFFFVFSAAWILWRKTIPKGSINHIEMGNYSIFFGFGGALNQT